MTTCDVNGLINHTWQALMSEPEDDPSGPEDMDTLVRVVSLVTFGSEESERHAQDCVLAAEALRARLGAASARSSAPARFPRHDAELHSPPSLYHPD